MKGFVEFWGNAVYRHTVSWRVPRSAPGQLGSSEGWGGGRWAFQLRTTGETLNVGSSPAGPGLPVLARLRAPHRLLGVGEGGSSSCVLSIPPHFYELTGFHVRTPLAASCVRVLPFKWPRNPASKRPHSDGPGAADHGTGAELGWLGRLGGGWGQQFSGWDLRWNTDRGCWIHDTQCDEGRGSTLYIKLCPKHRFWNQKDLGLNLNLATLTPHL